MVSRALDRALRVKHGKIRDFLSTNDVGHLHRVVITPRHREKPGEFTIMAKAKPAKSAAKPAKKAAVALLSKPKKGEKAYTKSKLIAHLAAAVSGKGFGEVSKKQAAAFVEEFTQVLFAYAPVGAPVPGLGKVILREIPAKPARTIVSFGKEIKVAAKPKSQKVVFRFAKEAKEFFKK